MKPDAKLARQIRRGRHHRIAVFRPERGAQRVTVAHQRAGHLGRLHVARAFARRLAGKLAHG